MSHSFLDVILTNRQKVFRRRPLLPQGSVINLKWIFKSLWEVHKWQYAPHNTNLSVKLRFSLQKTLQCKPCTRKSNRELEKKPSTIIKRGAVFMDLSKAFYSIPHDMLIAKMEAYSFIEDFLTFLYSYLKRRKESVNISNVHSMSQIIVSVVHKDPF